LHPVTPESVVLAFGDSLTSGVGAEEEASYPAVLARLLGCRVVNGGVAGEVTREGLVRLPDLLQRHQPQMVILCFGGNDMLRKLNDEEIARNLREMVRVARQAGADVVLLGVPQPGLLRSCAAVLPGDCGGTRSGLRGRDCVADSLDAFAEKRPDPPNASGYRHLAERLAEVIRKHS
jgi:lysophospholipase L1-like esterase